VSGLADTIAVALDGVIGGLGPRGVLVILMLATIGLTSAVTNNAAAALMFPLGLSTADDLGMSVRAVTVAITLAASMSFLTPIAYQTNLMVYGPAGYRFSDYARLGVPLTVLLVLLVVILVPLEFSR
jgi:di/tricarboxylate transporter